MNNSFNRLSLGHCGRALSLTAMGLLVAFSFKADGAVIISPTGVISNTVGNESSSFGIGNTIDQSGLSITFVSGLTDYSAYISSRPEHEGVAPVPSFWLSPQGSTTGTIVYDLGGVYRIERAVMWHGGGEAPERNVNGISLATSLNATFTTSQTAGDFNVFGFAPPYNLNDFDLTDTTGRYVRLTINSNYGSENYTKFGEIAFAVSAIPEPSSLLLLGGAAGLTLGRRKRV